MIQGVSYKIENLTEWNVNRKDEIELDAVARVYLSQVQITDRDRMAFALRELRKRGRQRVRNNVELQLGYLSGSSPPNDVRSTSLSSSSATDSITRRASVFLFPSPTARHIV